MSAASPRDAVRAVPVPPIMPQLLLINQAGTRLFITLNFAGQAGKVVVLDITAPAHPQEARVVDLGLNSGPHYLVWSKNTNQVLPKGLRSI